MAGPTLSRERLGSLGWGVAGAVFSIADKDLKECSK